MKLMLLVTADHASVEPITGKLNILGAYSRIVTTEDFPKIWHRIFLALKIRSELTDHHDERKLIIEIIDEDAEKHFHFSAPFRLPKSDRGLQSEFNAVIELNTLKFPHPGVYTFTVSVDGDELGRTPVEVIRQPK
jgi:hypothetical protein